MTIIDRILHSVQLLQEWSYLRLLI